MFDKAKNLYKMQKEARRIKNELKKTHIEAEDEDTKIIVVINGEQEIIEVKIPEEATQNKEKLEKSLVKTFNRAVKKSQQIGADKMKDIMGDLNFPGFGG